MLLGKYLPTALKLRRASFELKFLKSSVHDILHEELRFGMYKMQTVHYIERLTPPLSKRRPHLKTYMSRRE
jgi:hypothetical protein